MSEPLGIEIAHGAGPLAIGRAASRFDNVDLPLWQARDRRSIATSRSTIAPGERVGLVGHSGSGKTTFVKLIQRLYDVNAGAHHHRRPGYPRRQQASLRQQIAIVQQEPILFHRSLAENIAYARPGASRGEIIEAARLANAHDFISRLPKGYETLVGERGVKLSGGERQRVAIARAFLADAPVLILDEATSSLDSESEVLIQQAMERLMVGRTTLVIAHRLSTVRALDRLLVFDKGGSSRRARTKRWSASTAASTGASSNARRSSSPRASSSPNKKTLRCEPEGLVGPMRRRNTRPDGRVLTWGAAPC